MAAKLTLDEILTSAKDVLTGALSDNLVSIIHYGVHASGELNKKLDSKTPIRLLVVLEQLDGEQLEAINGCFENIVGAKQVSVMLLMHHELEHSTDVFPITFLEMQRQHRLVAGRNVIQDLFIHRAYLRLQCEQELKRLVLQMQTAMLTVSSAAATKALLSECYESFVRIMSGAVSMFDIVPPTDESELLAIAGQEFKFDTTVVDLVGQSVVTNKREKIETLKSLLIRFISVVRSTANTVDKMTDDILVLDVVDNVDVD